MKILLTGATGFIGQHLVEILKDSNHFLRILVRKPVHNLSDVIEQFLGDLTDDNSLRGVAEGVDWVIHTAALTSVRDLKTEGEKFNLVNVIGTENLLQRCEGINHFVHFSSVDALGPIQGRVVQEDDHPEPKHPYDFSKLASENLVKEYSKRFGFKYTILRPGMVYGEGESDSQMIKVNSAILTFAKLMRKHLYPTFGSGNSHLPLVYVGDIAQAVRLCLENPKAWGQIYQVCAESSPTMNELVSVMANELGITFPGPHIPLGLAKLLALVAQTMEKLTGFSLGITRSSVDYLTQDRRYSIEKIQRDLGYSPLDLKTGIHRTFEWYKEQGEL